MNPDYQKLLQRVEALEKWKAQKERQQISYPLDIQSQEVLGKYVMRITDRYDFILYGVADHPATRFMGVQGNNLFQVEPKTLFRYTVNTSNDEFTVQGTNFVDDEAVLFTTNDTLPSPLDGTTTYYVVNSSGGTFEVSLTVGGAVVNITDTGVGSQYIYREL